MLIGRLTRDPELKFTAGNGTAVATFSLAVDRKFKNKEGQREADFINIVSYGKPAETIANYLKKGKLVAVSGRIETRTYEGNDGQKKYYTDVVLEDFQFLEKKEASTPAADDGFGDNDFFPVENDTDIPF
jgi:single-strand DNA-binding protein